MQQWTSDADATLKTERNPSWWTDQHSSAWQRTKEALRRDWEQTKADVSSGGHELNQDVGDTVKQAAGKQAIPPGNAPNSGGTTDWDENEPAIRFGYGASQYYTDKQWTPELEGKMRSDWDSTGSGSSWDRVKAAVRRGWESVKRVAD